MRSLEGVSHLCSALLFRAFVASQLNQFLSYTKSPNPKPPNCCSSIPKLLLKSVEFDRISVIILSFSKLQTLIAILASVQPRFSFYIAQGVQRTNLELQRTDLDSCGSLLGFYNLCSTFRKAEEANCSLLKLRRETSIQFELILWMGISKTEVNLRRLLAAASQQQNQAKLVHYVATLREQLEQLAEEKTPEGLPGISKAMLNDYSEKIEATASKLVNHVSDVQVSEKDSERNFVIENPSEIEEKKQIPLSSRLRRRPVPASSTEDRVHEPAETNHLSPVKLDAAAHAHIEKHRNLQEDLTDEMVVLAKQLKESSLMMSQSLQNTEKILDSTEKAIEHSLASTGRANVRATAIYSESSKTSCLTSLVIFVMTCVFVMVILLIRVT